MPRNEIMSHRNPFMMIRLARAVSIVAIATFLPSTSAAADAVASLRVFPAEIELRGQDARQGLVIQQVDAQGVTRDVTELATVRVEQPTVADLQGRTLVPRENGSTKLLVEHGDLSA